MFLWRQASSTYELLIAEVFLRRTNAASVEPTYRNFLSHYPTIDEFAQARKSVLLLLVRRLGLNWRADNLVSLSEYFRTNGTYIPLSIDELERLPGVGPYIARSVLINVAGHHAAAVDSNVVRVVCRIFGYSEDDRLRRNQKFQNFVDDLVPKVAVREFNYALLDFAAIQCKKERPLCFGCPFNETCAVPSGRKRLRFE